MKRLFQHREHFYSQLEAGNFELPLIVTIPDTGEDVAIDDMMVGIDSLPPRQREAFELICLGGWTETDATRKMLPDSQWSTPVQQYADSALARMIKAYDTYQATGVKPAPWKPKKAKEKTNDQAGPQASPPSDGGVLAPEPADDVACG